MPKIVDHEKRRAEIVDAAREFVLESGARALTLRGLTRHMGVANGALRLYFPTKSDLIEALVADAVERTRSELRARDYDSQRGLAALRSIFSVVLESGEVSSSNLRVSLVLHAETASSPTWQEANHLLRAKTLSHVLEATEDGEIDGRWPAAVTTYLLINFASGRALQYLVAAGEPVVATKDAMEAFEALLRAA